MTQVMSLLFKMRKFYEEKKCTVREPGLTLAREKKAEKDRYLSSLCTSIFAKMCLFVMTGKIYCLGLLGILIPSPGLPITLEFVIHKPPVQSHPFRKLTFTGALRFKNAGALSGFGTPSG